CGATKITKGTKTTKKTADGKRDGPAQRAAPHESLAQNTNRECAGGLCFREAFTWRTPAGSTGRPSRDSFRSLRAQRALRFYLLRELRGDASFYAFVLFVVSAGGRRDERVPLAPQDDPVRALLLVHVEPLAVVAPHALALHDPRPADGTPLAGLLTNLAAVALGPPLDPEHRQVRQDPEHRADRAEEAAIEIANEDRGQKQHRQADPHARRAEQPEHPERLDEAVDADVARGEEVGEDDRQYSVLD